MKQEGEKDNSELEEILRLASAGEETHQQRTERNALLRQKLAAASGLVVGEAALKIGNLATRELFARLEEGRTIPIGPLFEIVHRMASWGIARRQQIERYNLIKDHLARYSTIVPREEVVGIFNRYLNTAIERDTPLLEVVLRGREDKEDIITDCINQIPEGPWRSDAIERLGGIRSKAAYLQQEIKS